MNTKSVLLDKLEQISSILSENYKDTEHVGLVIEKINEGYSFPTFCTGIAGAGWAIELLREEDFVDIDSDELLSDLDDYLSLAIKQMGEENNFYDFLHGVIGIGFYFFKRYQSTKSLELKNKYKTKLLEIIASLGRTAKKEDDTITWESYLIQNEELKGFNLSLSHGMTSIINFLARLAVYDDFYEEAAPLMQNAIRFILRNENKDLSCSSLFPSWVYEGMGTANNERLAWCYGDLGIGFTLWRAGKVLQDDVIAQKGIATIENSCKRRDLIEAKVKDNGLCHGTFGMVQIYKHMYKETKKTVFKETADYWMEQGLTMGIHEDGYAGYMQWQGGKNPGWRNETNLLEGIAGIGLSIISYLAPFETKWDECLLIS